MPPVSFKSLLECKTLETERFKPLLPSENIQADHHNERDGSDSITSSDTSSSMSCSTFSDCGSSEDSMSEFSLSPSLSHENAVPHPHQMLADIDWHALAETVVGEHPDPSSVVERPTLPPGPTFLPWVAPDMEYGLLNGVRQSLGASPVHITDTTNTYHNGKFLVVSHPLARFVKPRKPRGKENRLLPLLPAVKHARSQPHRAYARPTTYHPR